MRIKLSSVLVDDQAKALRSYTETLGFHKKTDIPLGKHRWLTVVSPEAPNGTELVLEPDEHPAAKPFKSALVKDSIPFTSFAASDVAAERSRLNSLAVCWAAFVLSLMTLVGPAIADQPQPTALTVQYLEYVTPSVDETCDILTQAHGLVFGEPIAQFGYARTASLGNGGFIGVRAPMRESEAPIVRPYILVDDIDAVVKDAETAGAVVAIPPTPIPEMGKFAIYILGGIEHGLWQN